MTATVAADGAPLIDTPVTAGGPYGFRLRRATVSDITGRELITIAQSQTPAEGAHAYFQQYATCSF